MIVGRKPAIDTEVSGLLFLLIEKIYHEGISEFAEADWWIFFCLKGVFIMNKNTRNIVLTAMFVALGVALPQAFHAVPNAGSIFLPMHIPVLLAGFSVGPVFGLCAGILTPLLSHLMFGMPPVPVLPSMLFELAIYGLVSGLLTRKVHVGNKLVKIYCVLIGAMICGRVGYGLLNALVLRAGSYSLQAWLSAAFVTALPGIIIQLVLIPAVVFALDRAKLISID